MPGGFVFLCSNDTVDECLNKMVFGASGRDKDQALSVRRGDVGFLFNVDTKRLIGAFEAVTDGGHRLVPEAFGGKFPYQVKVKWSRRYRHELDEATLQKAGLRHVAWQRLITDDELRRLMELFESLEAQKEMEELDMWLGRRFLDIRSGKLAWQEFEVRVGDLFTIMGFDIERLGHATVGPYPDIVLYSPPELWRLGFDYWVVADCKHVSDYVITDKDRRALEEYIEDYRIRAWKRGLDPKKGYFLFIALSFGDPRYCLEQAQAIRDRSGASGALMDVEALLQLTLAKLKLGYRFNLARFTELLRGGMITHDKVKALFPA